MSEESYPVKDTKPNVISVRVEEYTFRRIMALAKNYGDGFMGSVVKMCIDLSLDEVEKYLKSVDAAHKESLKAIKVPKL
jgi:hypothetical protein